eukprot:CAMPEP_0197075590 /NCGR_PEP_ID=MMETSP1384-20130603/211690_1 /TAXON_ID=29189 /ORGANISM="Ammonia sp." /LENGTH=75 /DNA_ID=CAMNT_0042514439 /DNA_START=725 /DNA_END=952 /DNA_ORIENTATION=+
MPRRANSKQRLQKALQEQRVLEHELEQLNKAQSQTDSAKSIIDHVKQNGADPMLASAESNWAKANPPVSCSCLVM